MNRSDEWLAAKLRPVLGTPHDVSTIIHWIHAARTQRPVLFVGAGFSRNARSRVKGKEMRAWSELTEALSQDLGDHAPTHGDALWTAERFRRQHSDYELIEKVRWAVPDKDCDPGDEHAALVEIDWHSVLTFNYDTLLERTFSPREYHRSVISVTRDEQLVRSTAQEILPIVHLHGHIDFPDTIVLSLDDFRTYGDRHPMFLTVARQLLAQHPTLFLGFGATDPNFVAWSGWLADHLGAQTPPWIRLQFVADPRRREPDPGFDRYWSPRLRTVGYGGASGFLQLLAIMAEGIAPLENRDIKQYTSELTAIVGAVTTGGTTDEGNIKLLHQIDENLQQRWFAELSFAGQAEPVRDVLRQLLKSKGANEEELGLWLGKTRERAERERAAIKRSVEEDLELPGIERENVNDGVSLGLPLEKQRQEIRRTLGDLLFTEWLVLAVRHISPSPAVSGDGPHFDAVYEYITLRERKGPRSLQYALLELGLLLADKILEGQSPTASPREALIKHLGIASEDSLDQRRRELFNDSILRWELEHNMWTGQPPVREQRLTAQTARRSAFLAARNGDIVAARDLYLQAADRSRSEGEYAWIELMTIDEADFWMGHGATDEAPRVARNKAMAKRKKQLQRLASEPEPAIRDRASYRFHFCRTLDTLQCEARDQAYSSLHFRREPLEERLRVTEWHWLYAESRGIADELTHIYCSENDWGSVVRLWRRYGPPPSAIARVRHRVDAPRAFRIDEELVRFAADGNVPSSRGKMLACIRGLLTPETTQEDSSHSELEVLVKFVHEEIDLPRGNEATNAWVHALKYQAWSESQTSVRSVISRALEARSPDFVALRLPNLFPGVFGYSLWHRWLLEDGWQDSQRWLAEAAIECLRLRDASRSFGGLALALLGDESTGVQERIRWVISEIGKKRLFGALSNDVVHAMLDIELAETPESRAAVRNAHHTAMAKKIQELRDADKPVNVTAVGAWLRTLPTDANADDISLAEWLRHHLAEVIKSEDDTWSPAHPQASALAEVAAFLFRVRRTSEEPAALDSNLRLALGIAPDALPAVSLQFDSEWLPSARQALDHGFKANHVGNERVDVEDLQAASLSTVFTQLVHGRPILMSWAVGTAWLSGARSRIIAIQTCRFLGRYIRERHDRLAADVVQALVQGLCRALYDGRTAVASAAAEEIEILRVLNVVATPSVDQFRHDRRRAFRRAFELAAVRAVQIVG